MKLYDVYNQFDVEPVMGYGPIVFDEEGKEYLDMYGGHAVISVGHSHPRYVKKIAEQLAKLGFYSNAVKNSLQTELAKKLGALSGFRDFELFLCNSGAEANENALKLASFKNGKSKIISLKNSFHGRTSAAVRATENSKIQAPINNKVEVCYLPINDIEAVEAELKKEDACALIVEAIQGIGGCMECENAFLKEISKLCKEHNTILIMDEVQCGYGRSGSFFAFQEAEIRPDLITVAKGMGNGFPIGGVLINPKIFKAKKGQLGTTFGGNHLACAAGIAVLEIIENEQLIENARLMGSLLKRRIEEEFHSEIEVLGRGLMLGLKFMKAVAPIRKKLLKEYSVFTGSSSNPNIMRVLPPLNIEKLHIERFVRKLTLAIKTDV